MKTKVMNWMLTALLMLGLGTFVAACSDSDSDSDSGKTEEQKAEEQQAAYDAFWDVVSQLVSTSDITADYAGKTFEPTIGTADATNATTRIVATNTAAVAAERFDALIGSQGKVTESTQTYTWSADNVGTMTYTKVTDGSAWATVDVNIAAVPHLQKIIYREPGTGDNGQFGDYKAWYRFGDVVARTVDGQTEYWICVRPAFTYEGKEDSHWVCVNCLPTANVFSVDGSNSKKYWVPTGIGTDTEDMKNFAEMLYAIYYPDTWETNIVNGATYFQDFKSDNLKYHNKYFWQNVQDAWKSENVPTKAMNITTDALSGLVNSGGQGINLLYKGYSWWTSTSWNLTLYEASYTHGTSKKEVNLRKESLEAVKKNVQNFSSNFDCRTMGQTINNYKEFFGDTKIRWAIRHATGKVLNGGVQPAATAQIQGVTEVYRYYAKYPNESAKTGINQKGVEVATAPEVTAAPIVDNHAYVDLGLTSGAKWATCNVGATKPEESGNYYAWGETAGGKATYDWTTYKWCNGTETTLTRYCNSSAAGNNGYTDTYTELLAADDAAYANWGSNWRTPSRAQWEELVNECTWTWTENYNSTGKSGYVVTGKKAGYTDKSIFIPAVGYMRVASLNTDEHHYMARTLFYTKQSNDLYMTANEIKPSHYEFRCLGYPVRAVRAQ